MREQKTSVRTSIVLIILLGLLASMLAGASRPAMLAHVIPPGRDCAIGTCDSGSSMQVCMLSTAEAARHTEFD
jgi:hypothetical protein